MCYDNEGNKKRSYTSGRRSPLILNPNFPDPIPYSKEETEKHIYVRQVFMDQSVFKTHMSLYALAKKFRLCITTN
ncbi:unnamed protein product [Brassica rapa subsp. trilocularis]